MPNPSLVPGLSFSHSTEANPSFSPLTPYGAQTHMKKQKQDQDQNQPRPERPTLHLSTCLRSLQYPVSIDLDLPVYFIQRVAEAPKAFQEDPRTPTINGLIIRPLHCTTHQPSSWIRPKILDQGLPIPSKPPPQQRREVITRKDMPNHRPSSCRIRELRIAPCQINH